MERLLSECGERGSEPSERRAHSEIWAKLCSRCGMQQEVLEEQLFLAAELGQIDPTVRAAIQREEERQADKLIMIASESLCPPSVRLALGSVFTNIYAEGYPARRTSRAPEQVMADLELQLAYHRRYGDRRYYKGTEMVDVVEALAQRRVAELFATDHDPSAALKIYADEIYANVQPLSGAAANNAVYTALLQANDTILGMNLSHGGHLTHGSPINRSGKSFRVSSYSVNPDTGRIDYEALEAQALEVRPRMIVAGGSAYPWDIDWQRLRSIADSLPEPALVLADIAHPAGLVVAGLFPNPIGYADVTTFTTHKTMIGPRGAVILTTDKHIAQRIDRGVFPGEQGGPHINSIAAMAVAFRIAQMPQFKELQKRVVDNAQILAAALAQRGLTLAYGGTNTHMVLVDLRTIPTSCGLPVNGDLASRILDIAGLVCNKNTIAGDISPIYPGAIRLGTTWVTQRGLGPAHMDRVAEVVHSVLTNIDTFTYTNAMGICPRGKIKPEVLRDVRREIRDLVNSTSDRRTPTGDQPQQVLDQSLSRRHLRVRGERAGLFLQTVCSGNVLSLTEGDARRSEVRDQNDELIAEVTVERRCDTDAEGEYYLLGCPKSSLERLSEWLKDLSDGYILFDKTDVHAKVDGPAIIESTSIKLLSGTVSPAEPFDERPDVDTTKPYFVGQRHYRDSEPDREEYVFPPPASQTSRRTPLYDEHVRLGARMAPFAGWQMPIWYTGIADEHQAVRTTAGLFDVAHMGVLEVEGKGAGRFLNLVTTNYVHALEVGRAQYTFLLDPDGNVLDDILIYRRGPERYMLVVNAANAETDRAWLDAVNTKRYLIDRQRPSRAVDSTATIRDLHEPSAGADRRIDLALQGPCSLAVLQRIVSDARLRRRIAQLARFEFVEGEAAGLPVLIARTGYTGEGIGYELYVHPDMALDLWRSLLVAGEDMGVQPIGLGARDSLRTEAGLPLHGHELAGKHSISPFGAGYGAFVRLHKPFFVGRSELMNSERNRTSCIARFRLVIRGGRMVRPGDPVVDRRGECVGWVTSATAVDGVQMGLAYVDQEVAIDGTSIGIFTLGGRSRAPTEAAKNELTLGDRVLLHEEATVLTRFP